MIRSNQSGFTLIEMLMVILLVAILSAVAIPQFIDFRKEGKDAATQAALGAIRTGIVNASAQMKIRCGAASGAWPSVASVTNNSLITGTDCTATQITTAAEAKIVAQPSLPPNPWGATSSNAVVACTAGAGCNKADATDCTGAAYSAASVGWCYDPSTGDIWANSAQSPDTNKEHTF